MKNDILTKLDAVIAALNNVFVAGKANMANLCGSISMLEAVAKEIIGAEFAEPGSVDTNTR